MPTAEAEVKPSTALVTKSDAALASSAGARINIPLNLDNWRELPATTQEALLWFHQHCLDQGLTLKAAAQAMGYDQSTVFRVLKGTYTGNWSNIEAAIGSYRRIVLDRGTIQRVEFVHNSVSRMIWAALDYAVANNSITQVTGESGQGKSIATRAWRDEHNHGRSVYVIAPALGGTKALLRAIAAAVGVNKNLNLPQMHEALMRAFNRNRILIIDEAHRLLPTDRRSNPVNIEILRDLHDQTGCALAFISTQRFSDQLQKTEYQFEQLLGRIGMPVRLPRLLKEADYLPVLQQYVPKPSARLKTTAGEIVNAMGRMRVLGEVLKVATRIAGKARQDLTEEHVFKALALRKQMMGETTYAAKEGAAS